MKNKFNSSTFEFKVGDWFEGSIHQYAELYGVHPDDPHLHNYTTLKSVRAYGGVILKEVIGEDEMYVFGYTAYASDRKRKLTFDQFKSGVDDLKEKGLLKNFIKNKQS
jgi:hypothetical protein